jgi:hypothetical protein
MMIKCLLVTLEAFNMSKKTPPRWRWFLVFNPCYKLVVCFLVLLAGLTQLFISRS